MFFIANPFLLTNIILAWRKYLAVTSIFIWSGFDSSFRQFSASSPVLECSPRRNRDDYEKAFIGNRFAFYGHFGKYSWMI